MNVKKKINKKERRNIKNKKRELRRRKQVQHNQEKKCSNRLWSIPQPEEYTFDGRGHKKLYHYTTENHLPSILENGVIFGDVMTDHFDGFNTPNLTTENKFHNPSSKSEGIMEKNDYYRLTIKCPTEKEKLINYGWFDKTYCKGINLKLTSQDPSIYGEIFNQYIYLGHITPSMITEVKVWNKKTKYWDRPKKKEIDDMCFEYNNLTFNRKFHHLPSQTRIGGFLMDDYTGKVIQFQKENDDKELYKDLYVLTDYICKTLKGRNLMDYREFVITTLIKCERDSKYINVLINGVFKIYNGFVDTNEKLDQTEYLIKIKDQFEKFDNWYDEINKPVELKLVG